MAGQWGTVGGFNANGYAGQSQAVSNGVITVFVNGESSATAYPVAAGNMVSLVDLDRGKMWFKSTEANGMPCRIRTFEIKEVTPPPVASADTVTRKEFDILSSQLQQAITAFQEFQMQQGVQQQVPAKTGGRTK